MNANIMKTQSFHKVKFDLKGHIKISKSSFSAIYYLFNPLILQKLFKNVNIMKTHIFHKMSYDLKCHPRLFKTTFKQDFLAHSFINRF